MSLSELKKLSNNERLSIMAKDDFEQKKEFSEPQALLKSKILEMSKYVNMQLHTKFHLCLPNCETDEAKDEIFDSKKMLVYECGFNTLESDLFRLKKLSVTDTDDLNELVVRSFGLWSFLKTIIGKKQSE